MTLSRRTLVDSEKEHAEKEDLLVDLMTDLRGPVLESGADTVARKIENIKNCDQRLIDELLGRFTIVFRSTPTNGDGFVIRCVSNHIARGVENGFITDIEQGKKYTSAIINGLLDALLKIDSNEEKSDQSIRDNKISAYLQTLDNTLEKISEDGTLEKIINTQENLLLLPLSETVFHPDTKNALIEKKIKYPLEFFIIAIALKKKIAAQFSLEALTQGFSDDLADKYNRLNMLINESLNVINSYKAKQPINLNKLNAIAELANALEAIYNQPPNDINSENITRTANQLHKNLSVAYDHILQAEKSKSRLSGFIARTSSSTLENITTALKKDEALMSPKATKASFSANEKPVVNPDELVKNITNIMPAPEKPLIQEALLKDIFGRGGHSHKMAYFSKFIDMTLDDEITKYSTDARELLSSVLDAGYSSESIKGTTDGRIFAIIKNNITEAIKNGDILSTEDGDLHIKIYRELVLKYLKEVTKDDTIAKDPNSVTTKIIEPMERKIIQIGKLLNSLSSTPSSTAVFFPTTEQAMIEYKINYPDQISLMSDLQKFKKNIAKQLSSEASTQVFSIELANNYIRLNTLIEESLKIINSYQAKQPVNHVKVSALAELASALQAICNLPLKAESITPITNQLRQNLSVTKDHILKAETRKVGFITKTSSTLGNINAALKQDENLMSPETKKAFFPSKEKPTTKPEGLPKSISNIFKR